MKSHIGSDARNNAHRPGRLKHTPTLEFLEGADDGCPDTQHPPLTLGREEKKLVHAAGFLSLIGLQSRGPVVEIRRPHPRCTVAMTDFQTWCSIVCRSQHWTIMVGAGSRRAASADDPR